MGCCRFGLTDRDRFLDAAHRVALKDRNGLADPEEVAAELGIGLFDVTSIRSANISHCDSAYG
jgi:hypothetical protein